MNGARHSLIWLSLAAAAAFFSPMGRADNFAAVRYDGQTDRLIVTMNYRGTNPNHNFSLKWGACQAGEPGELPGVAAEILDDQYDDAAEQDFTTTVRLSLAGLPCPRPVNLTLRTAPRFIYTLTIPK